MTGFAFIFAPIAFHTIGPTPKFAATIAATIGTIAFFGYICAAVAALATLPSFVAFPRRSCAVLALLLLMTVLSFYETRAVVPRMEVTPLQTPAYDRLHERSSLVYGIVLLSGLAAFVIAAWPQSRLSSSI